MSSSASTGPTRLNSEIDPVDDRPTMPLLAFVPPPPTGLIAEAFGTPDTRRLKVTVTSFGFKYGIPVDADFVADMRFLPNPYWIPELRPGTGKDAEVADYVMSQAGAAEFLDGYVPVLEGVAGGYRREGKRFMTVAIGCTGGKHRSVAMSEEIARRLSGDGYVTSATHRDLGRE